MAYKDLNSYKTNINLADFINQSKYGYEHDRAKSSKNYRAFKGQNGDRLIVFKDSSTNFYRYKSLSNPADKGTIIDFVQSRDGVNLGKARGIMDSFDATAAKSQIEVSTPTQLSEPKAISEYNQIIPLKDTSFLNKRGITDEVLNSAMFKDTAFNAYHETINGNKFINTAFPIYGKKELESFSFTTPTESREIVAFAQKNAKFQHFTNQRGQGLWRSNIDLSRPIDNLIIVEHPIDAYSHHMMNPNKKTENNVYYATFGEVSYKQLELIADAHKGLTKNNNGEFINPPGVVKHAFDNDPSGILYSIKSMNKVDPAIVCDPDFIKKNPAAAYCQVTPIKSSSRYAHTEFTINCNSKTKGLEVIASLKEQFQEINKKYEGKLTEKQPFSFDGQLFADNSARIRLNFKNYKDNWKVVYDFTKSFKFNNTKKLSLDLSTNGDWNEDLLLSRGSKQSHKKEQTLGPTPSVDISDSIVKNPTKGIDTKIDITPSKVSNPLKSKWSLSD